MAELFLHNLDVHAGGRGEGGRAVAQVVQADRGQAGAVSQAAEASA